MVDVNWPPNVPHRFLRAGAKLSPGDRTARSPTDSGLARQRAVYSFVPDQISGVIKMTEAEMATYLAWRDGVAGGVILRPHPVTGAMIRCRLIAGQQGAPSPDSATPKWIVPIAIEVLEEV